MNYQNLVDKCKKAYKEKDLTSAYKFWEKIYDILDERLNKFDIENDEERNKCYQEFNKYMKQFTDDEVYTITDYGKQQAYRKMELEKTYNILDKSISLYELTKKEEMKALENFMSFYEWCILKSETDEDKYNIYDLQTNCIIDEDEENKENKTLNETIVRLVDRALDYELYEGSENLDDEEYEELMNSKYIKDLYKIQEDYYEELKEELTKELEYLEKRLDCCAYGKSDLQEIKNLKWKINNLESRC